MLQHCLVTLLQTTRYPDYEVIIVDNGSAEANAVRYREELSAVGDERSVKVTVLRYPAMNNAAVKISTGELLVLLTDHRQGMQALGATLRRHVMEHALLDKNLDSWRRAWMELPAARGL